MKDLNAAYNILPLTQLQVPKPNQALPEKCPLFMFFTNNNTVTVKVMVWVSFSANM